MRAVGCHIYAGGFSLGVREHFNVVAHFEDGSFGCDTARDNLGVDIYQKSDGWPVLENIKLVYCNPPCAPWSASSVGRKVHWSDDERVSHQIDALTLLTTLRPDVWMLESVRGMYNRGKSHVMAMTRQAHDMDYAAYFVLVDAANHGVPQSRRRFFLVFSKYELNFRPTGRPKVTAGDIMLNGPFADTRKTEMRTGILWQTIVDKVKPGESMKQTFVKEFPELIGVPKCGRGSFMLRRLDPNGLAQTFTGDVKTFHPTEDRFLTIGEAAALSGFPAGYRFAGPTGKGYNQIARGVLPPVAEYIAGVVKRGIKNKRPATTLDPREVKVFADQIEVQMCLN